MDRVLTDLYGLQRSELATWMQERGQPRYRADQLFRWVHRHLARSFESMTDLPLALRNELSAAFALSAFKPLAVAEASDSTKLLLPLSDGLNIECVRLRTSPQAASLCVSSQVGCAIRCTFCASGQAGLVRNLTAGEIVSQTVALRTMAGPARNVVFMGMGEPLHNLQAVRKAISILTDREGWGLSPQRITVATSGVAEMIRRLGAEGPNVELAVSLNAPDDALRQTLMPGVRDPVDELLLACDDFSAQRRGQPVTFAYVLLRGLNDQPYHAEALAGLLRGRRHHLNLILYNPVEGLPLEQPTPREAEGFRTRLERFGLNVSLRKSRGRSIHAACGQLRATWIANRVSGTF